MTDASAAIGTLLKMGDGGSPTETFTTIAEVITASGPDISVDTEDVTNHDSTNDWEEHIPTILRSGEVTFGINYNPVAATHDATTGLLADLEAKTLRNFQLVLPDDASTTWEFSAYVTGFSPTWDAAGKLGADVTLKPSGDLTLA